MNIFFLSAVAKLCAMLHCDKHVVKMIIEYAQLMSTAHRVLDGTEWYDKTANGRRIKRWRMDDEDMEDTLYKASHINHPSAIWARQTSENYKWLYQLWYALCKEYTHRYGKTHATYEKLAHVLIDMPKNIEVGHRTTVPQAMPDDVKCEDTIEAYQQYYRKYKKDFARWTKRDIPEFMTA